MKIKNKMKWAVAGLVAITLLGAPVAANATAAQGNGHTPVTVCHNGSTLTIDDNALAAHLNHGDTEGPCQESTPTQAPTEVASPTAPTTTPSTGHSPATTPTATPTDTPATQPTATPVETAQPTEPAVTSPTTVAPQPSAGTTPTTSPKYILAVWRNEAGAPKFPQYLVASYATDSTNVKVLDQYAQLCGTFYQSDLYANDERTAKLIPRGVLNGGDESWPDGGTQRYDTVTTQPCPPTTPEVTPSPSTEPTTAPTTPTNGTNPTSPVTTAPTATTPTSVSVTPLSESPAVPTQLTEQKDSGTTEARAGKTDATAGTLAFTGVDNRIGLWIVGILLAVGTTFLVVSNHRRSKLK